MKRSILGSYLLSILFSPEGGEGGGAAAAEAGAGLSVTGDAEMDAAVMGRLGIEMETEPSSKSQVPNSKEGETDEKKAERQAAEAESNRILELVKTSGKTKEEIVAEEAAAKETADADRETLIEARMAEKGIERAAADAEITAEAEVLADGASVQAPELTPEVKTWVDEQIAAKDTEFATLKEQHDVAVAEVEELKGQLAEGGTQPLGIAPIDPLFLIDDPALLETEAGKLRNFEAWALKNWDGVDPVEASADGKTKAHPGFTADQIRERYLQVKELRETILPTAREGIKNRQAHEAQARKVYPALFDAKKPEFKVAQNLLRLAPGLKAVIPNIHIVIGDALRGERIRVAEEKARAAKGKTTTAAKAPPKAPAKPSAAAPRTVTPAAKKTEDSVNTDKFTKMMEGGADGRQALIAALG